MDEEWFEKELEAYCIALASELDIPNAGKNKIKMACHNYVQELGDIPSKEELARWIEENDPVVEGISFGNRAVVDTGPLVPIKSVKRFLNYCAELGNGQLIFTPHVLAELQQHKIISPIVKKSKFLEMWPEYAKMIETGSLKLNDIKQEIVDLINSDVKRPKITLDNIKFVNVEDKFLKEIADRAAHTTYYRTAYQFKNDMSDTDQVVIAAIRKLKAPVVIVADQHLENIKKMKDISEVEDLKILSPRFLGGEDD